MRAVACFSILAISVVASSALSQNAKPLTPQGEPVVRMTSKTDKDMIKTGKPVVVEVHNVKHSVDVSCKDVNVRVQLYNQNANLIQK